MKATPKSHATPKCQARRVNAARMDDLLSAEDDGDPATLEAERHERYRWWISRSHNLPEEHRSGWVLSVIMDEFANEQQFSEACQMEVFSQRMDAAGLGPLLQPKMTPRQRCRAYAEASDQRAALADEQTQRIMLLSVQASLKSYAAGIKCWAAFMDAAGHRVHFPASEQMVLRWCSMFSNAGTLSHYVTHLRWAHRFLRLSEAWDTKTVRQVVKGVGKVATPRRPKTAVTSKTVQALIKEAVKDDKPDMACLMAVGRLFMLRIPSEGIPLEWNGTHSSIEVDEQRAVITLATRKNSRVPVKLVRRCCCVSSGRSLCAVHWLLRHRAHGGEGRLFKFGVNQFVNRVRTYATKLGMDELRRVSTHAFRRGMAQDILDLGGNVATLLRAGDWSSSAFLKYVRYAQPQEVAISQAVIDVSDSDDGF